MSVFNRIKKFVKNIKIKKLPDPTLYQDVHVYDNFLKKPEIAAILDNMPNNLTQMEKAYYVYLELAKLLSENPNFCYAYYDKREENYYKPVDDEYYGICKSMSELYVRMLRDKRIGINARLVKQTPDFENTHIDTIFNIDGKNYICNLIGDLTRVQGNSRTKNFCFDLREQVENPAANEGRAKYLKMIEAKYGELHCLPREEIEAMDRKLGYSYPPKQAKGIYTDETISMLSEEFKNPEKLKQYVIGNPNLSDEELENGDFLKQKIDYILKNLNGIVEFNKVMNYQERIRLLMYIGEKLLSRDEMKRINPYVLADSDEYKNLISVLKVEPLNHMKNQNVYYVYSNAEQRYVEKNAQELKTFLKKTNRDSLNVIGKFDGRCHGDIKELEL